ncbi:MAG: hypothetical protein JNK21_00375 [Rhodospirillaceae bacterium]|nr:hypothetical protein [Rhodospirillaceae bacterium]
MKNKAAFTLNRRQWLTAAALAPAFAGSAAWQITAAEPPQGGPQYLAIAYRCAAQDRPGFRAYWQGEAAERFQGLLKKGVLKSWQILFNPIVDTETWDALVILGFTSFEATRAWYEIERTAPGGLTPAGLKLARPIYTISADLQWSAGPEKARTDAESIYYVIPYEYNAADQYRKYVDAYVIPQVSGWMKEGVLKGYQMFMNRYPVGRTWDSLFVYQYSTLETFGRRDETVAKVRKTLVDDPVWKNFHEIKKTIREESENTIAEMLRADFSTAK